MVISTVTVFSQLANQTVATNTTRLPTANKKGYLDLSVNDKRRSEVCPQK
jgi:hypothetical protein